MSIKKLSLKTFTVVMAFCLLLSFSFFAFPETASAIDHDTILSPTNNSIYIIGNKITVKASPLLLSAQGKSYMQVEILKSGKRVYFENKRFTSLDNITMPSFKPTKTGKYTIKAGIVITDDDPPDYIHHEQDKATFTVKKASSVKDMKPSISAKRDGKKITISCSNRPSGVKMNVYRSTKKNSGYEKVKSLTKDSYTDKVKSSTKTYYYKVRFTYKYNKKTYTSKYSKKLTVKKVVKTTGSSLNLNTPTYTSSGKVKLSWDLVKGAGYYLIHKTTSKTGEDVDVFCMGGDESVYYDADVKAGKTYYYYMEAFNEGDEKLLATSDKVSIKIPS